jgi:hypothetical protein
MPRASFALRIAIIIKHLKISRNGFSVEYVES